MLPDSVFVSPSHRRQTKRARLCNYGALAAMAIGTGVAFGPVTAMAEEPAQVPALTVTSTCPPRASVGRLVCRVDVAWPAGARVLWLDLIVQSTPDGVRPLRSRIPGKDATAPQATRRVFELALVVPAAAAAVKEPRASLKIGAAAYVQDAPNSRVPEPARQDVEGEIQFQVRAIACQGAACGVVTSNAVSRMTLTGSEPAHATPVSAGAASTFGAASPKATPTAAAH